VSDRIGLRSALAGALLAVVVCAAPAHAQSQAEDVGYGIGAGLSSLLYFPAKVVYAGLGTVVSGISYVLTGGDGEVARPIFESAVYGDYVVTPEVLRGREPLEFVGRPSDPAPYVAAPASDGF